MTRIPSPFEQELHNQAPTELDVAFLERLTACAEGTDMDISAEEADFEKILAQLKPHPIPSALSVSLLEAIQDTPFAIDEKIVLFHKSAKLVQTKTRRTYRVNLAAAAAVALLGSLTAFILPSGSSADTNIADGKPKPTHSETNPYFAPASYGRNLSETHDEGVLWRGKNQPHRVLRLTYTDMVTMKNENGETYQVEHPRHEYVIIPEKID